MEQQLQVPLDLPDVRTLNDSQTETSEWLIQVESTVQKTTCRKFGQAISQFHGLVILLRLQHLPLFEISV